MGAAITDTIIDAAIIVGRTDGGDSTSSYTGRFAPTTVKCGLRPKQGQTHLG